MAQAELQGTMAYTSAIIDDRPENRHVTGYQNSGRNLAAGPNCMLLHFPGNDIELVQGPEQTLFLMHDITARLPELGDFGMKLFGTPRSARVESYGDYDVVLAEYAGNIIEALQGVRPERRPVLSSTQIMLIDWYTRTFDGYSFVLACFDGSVNPRHPIVVEYVPHNDDMLFVPGIDCHSGGIPVIGAPMQRNFKIAFGTDGIPQPYSVDYTDGCGGQLWAPNDVTGFWDNLHEGPNCDYWLPLESVNNGFSGRELYELCN